MAICLMATCSPSLFLKPAYTVPNPPLPSMGPTRYALSKGSITFTTPPGGGIWLPGFLAMFPGIGGNWGCEDSDWERGAPAGRM